MTKRIYLDYASSTPVDPAVQEIMKPYFSEVFGNAGAVHQEGQKAQAAVFEARQKVADFFGCDFKEIIFTGSATESNNLAIRGVVKYAASEGKKSDFNKKKSDFGEFARQSISRPHIITSSIEHKSVLETCHDLEKEGVEVTYLPVTKEGFVRPEDVRGAIKENTVIVSIGYANSEIGTVQPITEISNAIRDFRNSKHEARNSKQIQNSKSQIQNKSVSDFGFHCALPKPYAEEGISDLEAGYPLLHTDAVQAINYLDCNVESLGVDLLTFSGHKIYGPKGIGGLYARKGTPIEQIITGGNQEMGFRSGTENVPLIVGVGKAVELIGERKKEETARISELRNYFIDEVLSARGGSAESNSAGMFDGAALGGKNIPNIELNGSPENRVANNANFLFRGVSANSLLIALDQEGIAASSGSTCTIKTVTPSHVVLTLGRNEEEASQSIRFTLGRSTTKDDIDYTVSALRKILTRTGLDKS